MDKDMQALMGVTANVMQKWEVIHDTDTRRGVGGIGYSMGKLRAGATFFGNWIVNNWVKDNDSPRWIRVLDCQRMVSEEPPEPPPSDSTLCWLKTDYQLRNTPFKRARTKTLIAHPQTMIFSVPPKCSETVRASDDYIGLTLALNPGMTYNILRDVMNACMPQGHKWGNGDDKLKFSVQFASNTIEVLRKFRNGGGMPGIPSGAWMYDADVLDYDHLPTSAEEVKESQKIHFTISRKDSPIVNPPPQMGGRSGHPVILPFASPVPLYFRTELGTIVKQIQNQYNPPAWEK